MIQKIPLHPPFPKGEKKGIFAKGEKEGDFFKGDLKVSPLYKRGERGDFSKGDERGILPKRGNRAKCPTLLR